MVQLGVRLRGGVHKPSLVQKAPRIGRCRQLTVRVQAEKTDFGTQILRGFQQGLGTLKLNTKSSGPTGTQQLKPGGKGGTTFLGGLTVPVPGLTGKVTPDGRTVFVAGATGRVGARVVRELLTAGFRVRAGVRNVAAAKQAVDVAEGYGLLSPQDVRALQIVEVDLAKPDSIKQALGGASRVVCALGASESEALNLSQPKVVDGDYTTNLITAASDVGVEHFVLVTSLGTGKVGFPASVLNLFGGVLYWKRGSEKALETSGMAYTIVRPGGMERPTDSYKKTHNMVLSPRDTTFGGQVSRLQVAELIGSIISNPDLAANKVLEVTAETSAPLKSYEDLLQGITADFSMQEQQANREAVGAARGELAEAEDKLEAARANLAAADGRLKDLNERLKTARAQESEAKAKVAPVLKQGASAEQALDKAKAAADKASLREAAAKAVLDAARKAAAAGQLLDKKQQKAIADEVLNPRPAEPKRQQSPALAVAGAGAGAAAAAAAAKPLLGFLGGLQESSAPAAPAPPAAPKAAPKAAPAAPPAPTPAPAAAKKEAPAPAKPPTVAKPRGGFNLASFFGIPDAVQLEEGAQAPKVPAAAPSGGTTKLRVEPPKPAAPPAAPKAAAPAPAAPKAAPKPAPPAPAPEPPKPQAAAPAPPPAPKPVAKPVEAEAPKPAPPPPRPAPARPSPPVEDPADVERRMLEALAEERRAKALAAAKKRLEAEAKAIEAAKAAAAEAARQKAPSPEPQAAAPTPAPAPKPAPAAAPKAAPAAPKAAPAQASSSGAPAAAPAEEKKQVQQWISAWQQKQAGGDNKAAAPAERKSEKKSGEYDAEAAAKAKAQAQAWIAAWQAKQAAGKK